MVMSYQGGGGIVDRLPSLWRRIDDSHYAYLETEDSPEKLHLKKKLEGYITEYLQLVPHECKFGLSETSKVFERTVAELPEFSAYRAGLGWAALERYAANLLAQPWRKEYKILRLYCGYYKHEVEARLVGAQTLLHLMGYKRAGHDRLTLETPICPDMVRSISRDAFIARVECKIMAHIWEEACTRGARVSWPDVLRQRASQNAHLYQDGSEIYSNMSVEPAHSIPEHRYLPATPCSHLRPEPTMEPLQTPMVPYIMPNVPQMVYPPIQEIPVTVPQCNPVPMMTPYGVPYYYPVQTPYMVPTPVYAPIKHANTIPVNGYPPIPTYRYPSVPTGQLIELSTDTPSSVYENGKYDRHREEKDRNKRRIESSRRNSTSKSGFSDISLPSLPRSDTQPTLSKAKEDGMGTYESWDYVFRNLSSKDHADGRSAYSPSDRDSRTLDRLDREERRTRYQPTTLDLEDGLQALTLDRAFDEDAYRTAKVNENLMRLKQEQEMKRAKHLAKKQISEERKYRRPDNDVLPPCPSADGLITSKVAPDKVRLLTKQDVKDRKDVLKQQNSVNGSANSTELKKIKKSSKLATLEVERHRSKSIENGVHSAHSSKLSVSSYNSKSQPSRDEPDTTHRSKSHSNSETERPSSRASSHHASAKEKANTNGIETKRDKWECATCTYINKASLAACEMCGRSKKPPEIQPLTSGGRECPACTLVNERNARVCDACGTRLENCPTYI